MITAQLKRLLFLYSLLIFQSTIAQSDDEIIGRHCGTYEYNLKLASKRTVIKSNKNAAQSGAKNYSTQKVLSGSDSIYTIPVVVHVVHHTNSENVADQQIESQIEVLNEDYSGTNLDIINVPDAFKPVKAGDVGIRFCLATLDPNNQPTNGIVRVYTDNTQFDFADDVKSTALGGSDAWPASQYLNVWVCNLSGSLLGYAQYPNSGPDSTDGVVIFYKAFGRNGTAIKPYNKGRTLTHEVGHWLNLLHIWGDDGTDCTGSDKVSDTPNQAGNTFKCPSYPQTSCGNAAIGGDMFMNYMDYTDDSCMCLFTNGQKIRMMDAFDNYRSSLKTSMQTNCTPLNSQTDYTTAVIPNPNNGNFLIRFKKTIPQNYELTIYDMYGHIIYNGSKTGIDNNIETGIDNRNLYVKCDNLAKGVYFFRSDVEGHTYYNKVVIFKN